MPRRLTRSALRGYPAVYRESLRRWCIGYARFLAALGAVVLALAGWSVYGSGPVRLAAVVGALFLFILCTFVVGVLSETAIVLYFEREVPGGWFTDSDAVSRNCVYLDEIAAAAGVSALSTFGFADDLAGETVRWHAPEQGLLTISRLSEKLRENPDRVPEAEAILAELEKMRDRLDLARAQGTRFCLLLHDYTMSGHEMDLRKGRF